MKSDPAKRIYDLQQFGEFGDVNPSITDSSTYTFLEGETMEETFLGHMEGCFLYSRHWNPSNKYLINTWLMHWQPWKKRSQPGSPRQEWQRSPVRFCNSVIRAIILLPA